MGVVRTQFSLLIWVYYVLSLVYWYECSTYSVEFIDMDVVRTQFSILIWV